MNDEQASTFHFIPPIASSEHPEIYNDKKIVQWLTKQKELLGSKPLSGMLLGGLKSDQDSNNLIRLIKNSFKKLNIPYSSFCGQSNGDICYGSSIPWLPSQKECIVNSKLPKNGTAADVLGQTDLNKAFSKIELKDGDTINFTA